jgi:hypothetical protein
MAARNQDKRCGVKRLIPWIDAELFSQACARVEQIVSKKLPALFRQGICQIILVDVSERRIMIYELTSELAGLYLSNSSRRELIKQHKKVFMLLNIPK